MIRKPIQYTITCSRSQLSLIAKCVEDLHKYYSGQQMTLENTINNASDPRHLYTLLRETKKYVTEGKNYDHSGLYCKNVQQQRFIALTYHIYQHINAFLEAEKHNKDVELTGLPQIKREDKQ